jgi:hypothetical protein
MATLGLGSRKKAKPTIDPALPPPEVHKRCAEFQNELRELTGAARRVFLQRAWEDYFGAGDEPYPIGVDPKLIEIRIAYEALWVGYRECGALDKLSPKVAARRRASARFKTKAFDSRMRDYLELTKEGATTMAGKKKAAKKARKTICSRVITILGAAKVPSNEAIIRSIQDEFPDSAFNGKHLSWYKNRFAKGELTGMDGKVHKINQAASESKRGKKAGTKKAAAKKAGKKAKAGMARGGRKTKKVRKIKKTDA